MSYNKYPLYKYYYKPNVEKIYELSKNIKNKFVFNKPTEIKQMINKTNINVFNPYSEQRKYNYVLLEDNYEDNIELNYLTDYFTLEERIKANFINNPSPIDYYNKHKIEIEEYLKSKGINKIKTISDYFTFDKYMFDNVRFTNNFRISIILKVLDIFKPKKWLDISAGWGDRLISAILYPTVKCYNSTDPNLSLHQHYKDIIKFFNVSKKHYQIKKKGFEDLRLKDNYYDIVFSSPPFFDMETYSNNENDSLIKHPNELNWYNDFLIVSLLKSFKALKDNHFLVLNISFYKKSKYLSKERLINDITKQNYIKHCGSIYYYNRENWKPREFIIFKKQTI